ncbi:hypothetical protein GDO86_001636, partial [Hymenochirus boettgeri]
PVCGDSVEQLHSATGEENESKTLNCVYRTSADYPCIYWYQQYPNGAMQFILRKSRHCDRKARGLERFDAVTDFSSSQLTISNLKLTDTAVYYCAVGDFHIGKTHWTGAQENTIESSRVWISYFFSFIKEN